MFINPINSVNHSKQVPTTFGSAAGNRIARNKYKILLTQDIWAPRLNIKMPETPIEKEVLLEVLAQRLKLDRFSRLTNERFTTKGNLIIYNDLIEKDPKNEKIEILRKELDKKGNLVKYFKTLDKQIQQEKLKNRDAINYFNNIAQMEEDYLNSKLIKESKLEKFAVQVEKNNINPNGKYKTKELIEIVESGKIPTSQEEMAMNRIPILSKKQLLVSVEVTYEKILRENLNIYKKGLNHNEEARKSRLAVEEKYKESIQRYPEIKKSLLKIYDNVENKFIHKVEKIGDVEIIPIGKIWEDMAATEKAMKQNISELKTLKARFEQEPENKNLKDEIFIKDNHLREMKSGWITGMLYSLKYENMNHCKMLEAGKGAEYGYLIEQNPILKKHAAAMRVYYENNQTIPDEYWEKILTN